MRRGRLPMWWQRTAATHVRCEVPPRERNSPFVYVEAVDDTRPRKASMVLLLPLL